MTDDEKNLIKYEFIAACRENDMAKIHSMFADPKIKGVDGLIDSASLNRQGFTEACLYGHIEPVKYLLTSPDVTKYPEIMENRHEGFRCAALNGHTDIVRFMASSSDLPQKVDIRLDNDFALSMATYYHYDDMLRTIVMELTDYTEDEIHAMELRGDGDELTADEAARVIELIKEKNHHSLLNGLVISDSENGHKVAGPNILSCRR